MPDNQIATKITKEQFFKGIQYLSLIDTKFELSADQIRAWFPYFENYSIYDFEYVINKSATSEKPITKPVHITCSRPMRNDNIHYQSIQRKHFKFNLGVRK